MIRNVRVMNVDCNIGWASVVNVISVIFIPGKSQDLMGKNVPQKIVIQDRYY